jgi:hypothetical protein
LKRLRPALALDLLYASLPPGYQLPHAVRSLLKQVLGLPLQHEVGEWTPDDLESRGAHNRLAQSIAWLIADLFRNEYGKRISDRRLAKEMRLLGYMTSTSTIAAWRKKSRPGYQWLEPEEIPEMRRKILQRWRAAHMGAAPAELGPITPQSAE